MFDYTLLRTQAVAVEGARDSVAGSVGRGLGQNNRESRESESGGVAEDDVLYKRENRTRKTCTWGFHIESYPFYVGSFIGIAPEVHKFWFGSVLREGGEISQQGSAEHKQLSVSARGN